MGSKKLLSTRKISLSLPVAVVDDLDYIANAMHISRSAVCSELLSEPIRDFRTILSTALEGLASGDDPEAVKVRARGDSLRLINERFSSLMGDDSQ